MNRRFSTGVKLAVAFLVLGGVFLVTVGILQSRASVVWGIGGIAAGVYCFYLVYAVSSRRTSWLDALWRSRRRYRDADGPKDEAE